MKRQTSKQQMHQSNAAPTGAEAPALDEQHHVGNAEAIRRMGGGQGDAQGQVGGGLLAAAGADLRPHEVPKLGDHIRDGGVVEHEDDPGEVSMDGDPPWKFADADQDLSPSALRPATVWHSTRRER